jgi:hypothetical protein
MFFNRTIASPLSSLGLLLAGLLLRSVSLRPIGLRVAR